MLFFMITWAKFVDNDKIVNGNQYYMFSKIFRQKITADIIFRNR